jgi:hypothetical protein
MEMAFKLLGEKKIAESMKIFQDILSLVDNKVKNKKFRN